MDRKELRSATSEIIIDTRKRCEEVLLKYLIAAGGSVDVKFSRLSSQDDTYLDEQVPSYVALSRVFIDRSAGIDQICVTTASDGEGWLMAECLTIDEMLSLMDCMAREDI